MTLSTPSLGITNKKCIECGKYIRKESFNSLSRDHEVLDENKQIHALYFQLPLSGSLGLFLSTPSLGITHLVMTAQMDDEYMNFQLPLSGSPSGKAS
jgi:hypothetical protein